MISLREQLSRRPGGSLRSPLLGWNEVASYVHGFITSNEEKARVEKAAKRQRLYQCRGDSEMLEMLQKVFVTREVIELRRQWIEFAKYNNVLRRTIGELATCYSQPAKRTVKGDANNAAYQEVQRLSRQDEVMQRVNRLAVLHRALAVGPRMRQSPTGEWEPTIDVVTPAKFHAIRDPIDPSVLAALAFENDFALAGIAAPDAPKWTIVGWTETMFMSSHGEILEKTLVEHEHGRIPWILLTLEPPDGRLIDEDTGEDLVAAQQAIWFLNVLHLKESKSATKQLLFSGDVSNMTRKQVSDSEMDGHMPEGVAAQEVDRSMDVSIFTAGAEYVADAVGANYGLAPSVRKGHSVDSAEARELQRVPLREIRLQQHIPFRQFEREFAALQANVISKYAAERPDLQFTTDGWAINFADPQTPLSEKERLEVFETKRKLGLTSTIKEKVAGDPDLDREDAKDEILQNIVDELWRNVHMRPLQAISGSPAAETPGGETPSKPGEMPEEMTGDESRDGASTAPVGDDADQTGAAA